MTTKKKQKQSRLETVTIIVLACLKVFLKQYLVLSKKVLYLYNLKMILTVNLDVIKSPKDKLEFSLEMLASTKSPLYGVYYCKILFTFIYIYVTAYSSF